VKCDIIKLEYDIPTGGKASTAEVMAAVSASANLSVID